MATVRIAHVEPRPGRQPDGGFRINSFLVVLADSDGGRALPIWFTGPDGHGVWRVVDPDAHPEIEAAESLSSRLLQAADVRVTGTDIEQLAAAVTEAPQRGAQTSALIEFTGAGAGAPQQMQVPLGYALAMAAAFGAPIRVADEVMDRLAVAAQGDDLLPAFLGPDAPHAAGRRQSDVPRFDVRNLTFADGLAGWEFGGSFRDDQAQAADYACVVEDGTAVVQAAVDQPEGFAALAQSVLIDEYVGRTVTFRAEVRTEDVADEAGLHLLGGMPTGPVSLPKSLTVPLSGSSDWTARQISTQVSEHGGMVQFGIFLRGPGRVGFRNPQLTFTPAGN